MTVAARRRDRLWNLLPEFHRIKDAEAGYPLRSLLGAMGTQFARVETDIENLWNDQFIETCAPWVIPYIADLVGVESIHDVDGTARVDVARTIGFRRRQGTLRMLEELAETVTGWETVVAEMFRRMAWTQHLNHLDDRRTTLDLRAPAPLQLIDGPFDPHMHTADVREPSFAVARANISNFAFFVHRVRSDPFGDPADATTTDVEIPLEVAPWPVTTAADEWRFFLHPLGIDTPVFHRVDDDSNRNQRVDENEIHAQIRTGWLAEHLAPPLRPDGTTPNRPTSGVIDVRVGQLVVAGDRKSPGFDELTVQCADLSAWRQPPPRRIYLDVERGRMAMAPQDRQADLDGPVRLSFASGTPGLVGANGMKRSAAPTYADADVRVYPTLPDLPAPSDADPTGWVVLDVGVTAQFPSLAAALAEWALPQNVGERTVIRITDSGTYEENVAFVPTAGSCLVIQAADGQRPFIRGNIRLLGGGAPPSIDDRMRFGLDGLWIDGTIRVTPAAAVDELTVSHSTVWQLERTGVAGAQPMPGPAVALVGSVHGVTIVASSVGGIQTSSAVDRLAIADSIVDGHGGAAISGDGGVRSGPVTVTDRTTYLGSVLVREIDASECIFLGLVESRRVQAGCIRYSFVPTASADGRAARTPGRYRCQPDLLFDETSTADQPPLTEEERAIVERAVTPRFQEIRPFTAGYCVLMRDAPIEIRRGAEEGLEMGAWNLLRNPHRMENLRRRTIDYLPYGLRPEIVDVS